MPVHEIALPVGAKNISPNVPTITRSSKDGNIPIAQLFGGDNFIGDILEGQWVKGVNSAWNEPFTAKIASGQLDFAGAHTSTKYGWINGKTPFLMRQNCYIDVHMKVQTVTPTNAFAIHFYLRGEESTNLPFANGDSIDMRILRWDSTTYISGSKTVDGSSTSIYSNAAITNDEGTFRFKFRPDDNKIDIYFHDGSGDVDESTDELILLDDDYDFNFEMGYPAFMYMMTNTTNYTVSSEGVSVSYPDMAISYEQDASDIGKGDVKCYDTNGEVSESDWSRVYSEGHDFVGDCVIQNGLIRLHVDIGASKGLEFYYWTGSTWYRALDTISLYLEDALTTLWYPYLANLIGLVRGESMSISLRMSATSSETDTNHAYITITIERGKHHFILQVDSTSDSQDIRVYVFNIAVNPPVSGFRWSYVGDAATLGIGDQDFQVNITNTTMSDNFLMQFDDAYSDVIVYMSSNQKPSGDSQAFVYETLSIGLQSLASSDFTSTRILIGLVPYQDVDKLFQEAEDGTTTGTDDVSDGTASGGYKVELDAQNEYVYVPLTGITDIPAGRYRLVARMKDSAQVTDDAEIYVYNNSDSRYMNEYRAEETHTLTSSWAFYSCIFDVTSDDSSDTIRLYIKKSTVTTNTIDVDYFIIFPISDGDSMVQDIAHNEMKTIDIGFRILDLASFEVFAGMGIFSSSLSSGYTNAMAIAAVENEQTLDLKGVLTASTIKTKSDGGGLHVGASDDLRIFHDGVDTYLRNNTGDMILQSLGGDLRLETADFFLDTSGIVQIRDTDDSDVVLIELDTGARTFQIGQAADLIETTYYGDITLVGELLLEAATIHSSAGQIHIHPNTGNTDAVVIIHPVGTASASELNLRNAVSADYGEIMIQLTGDTVNIVARAGGVGTSPSIFNLNDPDWEEINIGDSETTVTLGDLNILTVPAGTADYNAFLVLDGTEVKFRTGDQILADIGAPSLPIALVDIASYARGSIIIGGGTDWEPLGKGTVGQVLTSDGTDISWEDASGGGGTLAQVLSLGNESDGANIIIDSGGDLIVYSDDKVTEKARIDGATGDITTAGTVDGVDIAARDHAKYTNNEAIAAIEAHAILNLKEVEVDGLFYPKITDTRTSGKSSNVWERIYVGDSGIYFGTNQDVNLHRSAPNVLRTPDEFDAGGGLRAKGVTIDFNRIDDLEMYGSGNAGWVNCPMEGVGAYFWGQMNVNNIMTNIGSDDMTVTYSIPLATNLGGNKLHIKGTRVILMQADGDDYVNNTLIVGFTGASRSVRDTDPTNKNSSGEWDDTVSVDCSAYDIMKVSLVCVNTGAGHLDISGVLVHAYYA